MDDARRLLEQGATPFEARLLRHARSQEPTSHDIEHVIAAVGAAGALTLGSTVGSAAASAKGAASSVVAIVAKWAGIGIVAGVVTIGAAERARLVPSEAPVAASGLPVVLERPPIGADQSAKAKAPQAIEIPSQEVEQPVGSGNSPRAIERPAGVSPALEEPATVDLPPSAPPLSAETSLLDGARRALAERDFARAIAQLDAYAVRFEGGRLAPEAALIRVKVLIERGDRRAAEVAAQNFLDRNPDSPYAKRFRALLGFERARPTR